MNFNILLIICIAKNTFIIILRYNITIVYVIVLHSYPYYRILALLLMISLIIRIF